VTVAVGLIPTTSFIGRDLELVAVARQLAERRVLTVTGPGGTGKTRLVRELLRTRSADAWWVELASVADAGGVRQAVIDALGWRESFGDVGGAEPTADPLVERLRSRTGVLVLDNCEHVLGAAAELAHAVASQCSGVRVLSTSREPLGTAGEAVWRLSPLAVPAAGDEASDLAAVPSVQLFVDRVQLHDRSFRLDEDNAAAVVRICRALDGLPLALELAAPWLRVLSPAEAADRIEDDLDFVAAYGSALPERQRSLSAVLDWSYGLLDDSERLLFSRLSVFVGGFTLEAAEAVCSEDGLEEAEVLRLLARLVDTSLVVKEERAGIAWYRLLETVRDFSRRRLGALEAPEHTGAWAFRRDGDVWEVGPRPVRIPHAKGLGYIHALLSQPGVELHVLDLSGRLRDGDAGPLLDHAARSAYRERLADLRAEADEAAEFNDLERVARAEAEIDAIVTQLSAAVGIGGRGRVAGSATERARMSVTKAIRWAIQRLGQHDELAAAHLERSVKTGAYCRYDPPDAVEWRL